MPSQLTTFDLRDEQSRQAFQGLMDGLCKGARVVAPVKPLPVPEHLKGKLYSSADLFEAWAKSEGLV